MAFSSLSLYVMISTLMWLSYSDPNQCKTKDTKWRCTKVTDNGVVRYEWLCCNSVTPPKNCGYYELGDMHEDIDLSQDTLTVSKKTFVNDAWGSCTRNSLCRVTYHVTKYKENFACDATNHGLQKTTSELLTKKGLTKKLTKKEMKKLRMKAGAEWDKFSSVETQTALKPENEKGYRVYGAKGYAGGDMLFDGQADTADSQSSFVPLVGAGIVLAVSCLCLALLCFVMGGLGGYALGTRFGSGRNKYAMNMSEQEI